MSYFGPMFRYEKMQRGRYRQFSQIGIEILGAAAAAADIEVIVALHTFLAELGFDDLVIVLNNLGDPEDRDRFIEGLKRELTPHRPELCGDCQRRWDENPLRILDCKVPRCRELVSGTTPVAEVVSDDAKRHVEAVEAGLDVCSIPVRRAPRLVRGLDYYLRTVFEVVSPELGEETVICGGGRYDRLIADLGGAAVPGVGFAIGEDRLIDVLPQSFKDRVLDQNLVAVIPVGESAAAPAISLARDLVLAGVTVHTEVTGRSLKAGLKWASKMAAKVAVIIGEQELADGVVVVRDFGRGEQETVALDKAVSAVAELLCGNG
jgi:histidyl-tRNA synthetase